MFYHTPRVSPWSKFPSARGIDITHLTVVTKLRVKSAEMLWRSYRFSILTLCQVWDNVIADSFHLFYHFFYCNSDPDHVAPVMNNKLTKI